jgi:superfamily II DNA/RNA helicase
MNDDFMMTETSADASISEAHEPQAQENGAQAAMETIAHDAVDNTTSADQEEFAAEETPPAEPAGPSDFELMGLSPSLVQATKDMGFTKATSVQLKAIPMAMQSPGDKKFVDLMVSSQTGSGKTAAFLLPVLHWLEADMFAKEASEKAAYQAEIDAAKMRGEVPPKKAKRKDPTNARNFKAPTPGALIVCPTRELAQQVANDAIDLVRHMRGVRIASVIGGMPYQLQIAKLQNANLIVATPGRLLDLQRSSQIKCQEVKFLVVDEADRMLDLGFSDDLAEINQLTIERQQTMMFSATFASRIQQLAARVMREPQRITIDTPQEKHNNIKQVLFWADNMQHKRKLLDHWMRDTTIEQAIVFVSTQVECDGLANDLADAGFAAAALHGALSQGMRNRRLNMLREGRIQFLIATDVAARGIDVPSISHVFNYGLPMKAEDYTHRIGRTGRAGRSGTAVTIAEFRDRRKIGDIEFFTKQPIKSEVIPGLEPTVRERPARPSFGGRGNDRGGDRGGDRSFAPRERSFGGDRGGERNFSDRSGGGDYANRSGFNDRNSGGGGGFGGRTKSFSDGGWGGRPPREDARGGGFGGDQGQRQDAGQGGFGGPRPDPRGIDNRGGERSFAPRAPFGADRGQERGFQDRGAQDRRGQDSRGFEPRGERRDEARGEQRPFQRPDRPAYEPKKFSDSAPPKRSNTYTSEPRPFDDKRPAKKPFSPGKTGASSYGKSSKPKIVKIVGR